MREGDLSRLRVAFENGLDANQCEVAFRKTIDTWLPRSQALFQEIVGDLSGDRLGIGWWAPYPDKRRRILISDHLPLYLVTLHPGGVLRAVGSVLDCLSAAAPAQRRDLDGEQRRADRGGVHVPGAQVDGDHARVLRALRGAGEPSAAACEVAEGGPGQRAVQTSAALRLRRRQAKFRRVCHVQLSCRRT